MPFDYNPKDASNTFADGDYDAVLTKVEDRVTGENAKNPGEQMQVLHFTVYGTMGEQILVRDNIVRASIWKLKQLAIALGKKSEFDAGKFQADDNVGANVRVTLKLRKQDGYDDSNQIAKYLQSELSQAPAKPAAHPARPARSAPSTAPRVPVSPDGGIPEEDIPF